jgi:hypothetical protein
MADIRRHNQSRADREYRPALDSAGIAIDPLESRVMLSHAGPAHTRLVEARAAHAAEVAQEHAAAAASKKATPIQEITTQYAIFTANLNEQLDAYVASLNESSSSIVSVSTTVTTTTPAGSPLIPVVDASVFGPPGTYTTPVTATAYAGSVAVGQFSITGSTNNNLVINTAQSTSVSLPVGTILTGNVTTSAASAAGAVFPSYVTNSSIQLARALDIYFNSVKFRLPTKNTPPHTPVAYGAIQQYIYQSIAGAAETSMLSQLNAISLPATPGSDLNIYTATIDSVIQNSEQVLISGIQAIFAKRLLINAPEPNNRLGIDEASSSTGGSSSTSSSSTSSTTSA